jgi:cytidylate kinase
MAIITISRELAALGDETAYELSKLLGYRFIDKHALEERIKSFGVLDSIFSKYDERKPSFMASLSEERDEYLHFLKTAVFREAQDGNCIITGRGAFAVLAGLPAVLPVFLVAPLDIRVERVKSYFHCNEKRAQQVIEQSDRDRTGFHKYFFETDWTYPGNYRITLNTGHLHPANCARIIKSLADLTISAAQNEETSSRLKELAFAQMIVHHIIYEKKVPIHFLDVTVSGDVATLYGVANSNAVIDSATATAHEIQGLSQVRSEIKLVGEFTLMP